MSPIASQIQTIIPYPGAKWQLSSWICEHLPPHTMYLEPFAGSAAIFFNKPKCPVELLNDINGEIGNLFRVVRDRTDEIIAAVEMTPWSREEWEASNNRSEGLSDIERARLFIVQCWQSYGVKQAQRTGWKMDYTGLAKKYYASAWRRLPDRILSCVDRLRDAQIETRPALEVIKRARAKEVLVYADPPYIISTRTRGLYQFEMSITDHEALLTLLCEHPGPVVLSGLHHPFYEEHLRGWKRITKNIPVRSGVRENTEVLWIKEAQ